MTRRRPDGQPTLFPRPTTLRELLRRLIFGSPKHKEIALELFPQPADKVKQAYSRLNHTLNEDHDTNFDVDWLPTAIRRVGETGRLEAAEWLLEELGIEVEGRLRIRRDEDAERELQREFIETQKRANELMGEISRRRGRG